MKNTKIILAIGTVTSITAPIAAVVACGSSGGNGSGTSSRTNTLAESGSEINTYYPSATLQGKQGEELFNLLHTIQTNHTGGIASHGYGGLYDTYDKAFRDSMFDNDGSIVDIYSEKPSGADPYVFWGQSQKVGGEGYHGEGDAYNREHIVPQSTFQKHPPMHDDPHHVFPTDGKVNGIRSNYPHGNVTSATFTSMNGSQLGTDSDGNTVFEPIDEFKGDVARAYLYFQLTYQGSSVFDPFQNTFPFFTQKYLATYLKWSHDDPVDKFDVQRNEGIFREYNLRNPFIDFPNLDEIIFKTNGTLDTSKASSWEGINFDIKPTHSGTTTHNTGSTTHNTGTSTHHASGGSTGTSPVRVDISTLSTPDTSTWGAKWISHFDSRAGKFVKWFEGATYNDVFDAILDKCKNNYVKGSSLLRYNGTKWAIWDVPSPIYESHGHKFTKVQEKLTELGFPTSGQYAYDSAEDAIAALKALPEDKKAKLFNTFD